MKRTISNHLGRLVMTLAVMWAASGVYAQMPAAITIEPPDATIFDELTLIFDPAEACYLNAPLTGLPSVAIHSGVTLISGLNWQNVIEFNSTGANGQATTLEPTGDGKYSITFSPSAAAYYNIEEGTVVTQICAVFNNGTNWDQDGRDFDLVNGGCKDFFIPLNYEAGTPKAKFICNMTKMINDGNFDPVSDALYVDITDVGVTELVDFDQDKIYEVLVEEGFTEGTLYQFKFRINADQYETVQRQFTAVAGTVTIDVWWNDEALGQITFNVDMTYWMDQGLFDPPADFVDIAGTINGWSGSEPMTDIGDNVFSITYSVDANSVVEYKFRINGDWNTSEFPNGGPNRMTWATDYPLTLDHVYNDYNPNTWPVTFEVDMNTEITAGNFVPGTDYLDIAGSMNGWGGHSVLFDRDWTPAGVYTINMLIDTAFPFIEFKFRMNGDWATSEFPSGGPNRQFTAQDTTGGVQNLVQVGTTSSQNPMPPMRTNFLSTARWIRVTP